MQVNSRDEGLAKKYSNNPLATIKSFMETFATGYKTATKKKVPEDFIFWKVSHFFSLKVVHFIKLGNSSAKKKRRVLRYTSRNFLICYIAIT